jgi:hypothetical protein
VDLLEWTCCEDGHSAGGSLEIRPEISDIHSNLPALETVLEYVDSQEEGVDAIYHLSCSSSRGFGSLLGRHRRRHRARTKRCGG